MKKKRGANTSTIDFIANIERIDKMMREGYLPREIWRQLTEEGKIKMPYRTFWGIINPKKDK